jgi:phage shock protein A
MSVFSRFKRIVKSNINALLDKAEDPQKVMEQTILDMQAEMGNARESLTQAMVDERKLTKQVDQERGNADGWRTKAGQLLSAGNETAAKEALVRAKAAKEMLASKEKELEQHRLHVAQMKTVLDTMGKKIEMAKVKKLELSTRLKAVNHAQSLSSDLTVKEGDAFKEWAKFVDKIEEDETRAEVMREMSGDKLNDELLKAEADSALAPGDDELEKLKREMGIGQPKLEDKSGGEKA